MVLQLLRFEHIDLFYVLLPLVRRKLEEGTFECEESSEVGRKKRRKIQTDRKMDPI